MSASIAEILRAHGFVPAVPVVSPPTGDAETQAARHVPAVPIVPIGEYKGAIEAQKVAAAGPSPARIVADVRINDHPSAWFTVLGRPGQRFDRIRDELAVQYGGRLLQVRQHVTHKPS